MNKLAAMYNLSPEAAAGLSRIAGVDPGGRSPGFVPHDDAVNLDDAEYAPADPQAGALVARGVDSPNPFAFSNPSREPGWTPEKQEQRQAQAEQNKALAGANPQGPEAAQDFPTVRTSYGDPSQAPGAAQAMPMQAIPAHWQASGHSVALQHGMNPDELQEGQYYRDVGAGIGMQAADKRLESAQRGAQADALYAAAHTFASQQMRERMAQLEAERARYVQAEQAKLEKLAAEAQKNVDPNAYWKEKGPLGRIGAAIAIGLGQFGALMRGGPNTAYQMIQADMDRAIDAQKSNIANAKAAYDIRSNIYARNLQAFGDRERATLATKINYLDQVSGMVEGQRAIAKSADADAAALDIQKRIYDEKAKYADQFAELTHTKATEQMSEKFVPTQYVGGGAGQKGHGELYVPTLGGYARSKEVAEKLNNKGALRMQMTENMREIHELMGEAKGLSSLTSPIRLQEIDKRIEALVNDTLTKNTTIEGQGAMSKDDKAVAEAAKQLSGLRVQGSTNGSIERQQARVKEAADRVLKHHRLDGEANGIQVGSEQYRQGPNGPEPVRVLAGRNKTVTKNTESYDDMVSKPKGVAKTK